MSFSVWGTGIWEGLGDHAERGTGIERAYADPRWRHPVRPDSRRVAGRRLRHRPRGAHHLLQPGGGRLLGLRAGAGSHLLVRLVQAVLAGRNAAAARRMPDGDRAQDQTPGPRRGGRDAERPDGMRIPFAPHPTPLYDSSGALIGAVQHAARHQRAQKRRACRAASRGNCRILGRRHHQQESRRHHRELEQGRGAPVRLLGRGDYRQTRSRP